MPKLRITAASAEHIKIPAKGQVEYFDQLLPSFGLRVSYNGTKAWFVTTRIRGKLVRITIGRFPGWSLARARDAARQIKSQAEAGIDPREIQRNALEEEARHHRNTFAAAADDFLAFYARRKLRTSTVREYERILLGSDTCKLRPRPISDITQHDIRDVIDAIEGRGSPGAANRALAYLKKFLSWCVDRGLIASSPAGRIEPPHSNGSRDRVLDEEEIAIIWSAFKAEGGSFGAIFKLLLLTGQRRGEIAGMQWNELKELEVSDPIWEMPGNRTNNKLAHIVPLSSAAVDLIRNIHTSNSIHVFTTTGTTPVSGFGKAKKRIDAWISKHHRPLPSWTLHDLRRTMVTRMNETLHVQPHVVEAVVNHASGAAKRGVARVYNRALYMEERRQALDAWAQHIVKLTKCAAGGASEPSHHVDAV
jgi:integrase